jgi:hypothetical protein
LLQNKVLVNHNGEPFNKNGGVSEAFIFLQQLESASAAAIALAACP